MHCDCVCSGSVRSLQHLLDGLDVCACVRLRACVCVCVPVLCLSYLRERESSWWPALTQCVLVLFLFARELKVQFV